VEAQLRQSDEVHTMRTSADYKPKPPIVNADICLANELNSFYACFDVTGASTRQTMDSRNLYIFTVIFYLSPSLTIIHRF